MASPSPEVISIKRYPNRRLYDRQARRYITLQDLEGLVLEGKKIEVRDSRSGEDLTRAILTQILLERHPEKMEMFPVAMLHGILQANDMVLEFFRSYLRQSLAILEQLQKPTTPLSPFFTPMDWMRAMMPATLPFPPYRPAESAPAPATVAAHPVELEQRIAVIEERVRRLEAPGPSASGPDTAVRKEGKLQPRATAGVHGAAAAQRGSSLDRLEQRLDALEDLRSQGGDGSD